MYSIINRSTGELIALTDSPRYVKENDNEVFVRCSRDDADALVINGSIYNLLGKSNIKGADEVVITYKETGEYVFNNKRNIEQNKVAVEEIENATCELDATSSKKLSEIENALCEIDDKLNGGEW